MRWTSVPTTLSWASAPQGAGSPAGTSTSISLMWPRKPTLVLIFDMGCLLDQLAGRLDRGEDAGVGPATADVAGQPALDLDQRGVLLLVEQGLARHHHPRGAEPALQGVRLDELGLDGVQLAVGRGQPLDGGDLLARSVDREEHAGVHQGAVDDHPAAAAGAAVADLLRPGEIEVVAERAQQGHPRLHRHLVILAVDVEGEGGLVRTDGPGPPGGARLGAGGDDHTGGGRGPQEAAPAEALASLGASGLGRPTSGRGSAELSRFDLLLDGHRSPPTVTSWPRWRVCGAG